MGAVIGKGGKGIKEIEQATGGPGVGFRTVPCWVSGFQGFGVLGLGMFSGLRVLAVACCDDAWYALAEVEGWQIQESFEVRLQARSNCQECGRVVSRFVESLTACAGKCLKSTESLSGVKATSLDAKCDPQSGD